MTPIPTIAPKRKISFTEMLLQWNLEKNNRQMPWKGETDPYKIWLSEVILQQTRVQQGWQYYQRFVAQYPTVKHLAAAPDTEVFKLWEGLGYYSRCKNLLVAARFIAFELNGIFPLTYEEILALKGVGPYTAAAIASFAYGLPHAVVDGNVLRVLARWFGVALPIDTTEGKAFFTDLAKACLPAAQPAAYNQGIMDFGATICTPAVPLCSQCPLQPGCVAFNTKQIDVLPVKSKTLQKTVRWFTYFMIEQKEGLLVRQRTAKDIWQNLHEFYLQTSTKMPAWNTAAAAAFLQQELNVPFSITAISAPVRQQLTHQTVYITFIKATALQSFLPPADYFFAEEKQLDKLAFPKTLREMLHQQWIPALAF